MEYNIFLLVIALIFIGEIDTQEQFKPSLTIKLIRDNDKQRMVTIGDVYYVVIGESVDLDCLRHRSEKRTTIGMRFFHNGKQLESKYRVDFKMKLESRGTYYCKVVYNNGISAESKRLQLEVNPKPSIIYTATEGENAKFVCSVMINTNITFAWYLNQQRRQGENKKELVIENINRNQNGDRVTCEVLLNKERLRNATEIIDVHWADQASINVINNGPIFNEGDDIRLQCNINSNPKVTEFYWYENGKQISKEVEEITIIAQIYNDENPYYRCSSKEYYRSTRSEVKRISVKGLEVNLTGEVNVTLGQQLNLQCNINSNPSVSQITWFKDVNKLSTTNNTFQVIATKSDAGTYSCNARTDYHNKTSNKITVTVQYKPSAVQIKPEGDHLEVNITHDNYSIECSTTDIGVPSSAIAWYKNGDASKSMYTGKWLVLNFKTLARNDTGVYKCMASNGIGYVSKTVKLSILERPDNPVITSDSTSNSIIVSWQEPFNGNKPIQQYKLQLSANNNSSRNYHVFEYVVEHSVTKYAFRNLSANVNYSLTVRARNEIGWSSVTVKHVITRESRPTQPRVFTAEHREQEKSLHLKWLIPSSANGELIHYLICYYPLFEISDQLCVTTENLEYKLGNLSSYTKYNLTICGKTSKGYGTIATVIAQTEIEAPPPYTNSLPRIPLERVATESIKVPMVNFSTNNGPILCYDMVSMELGDHSTPTEHPNSYLNLRNKTFMETHGMILVARISNMSINRNILVKSIANIMKVPGMTFYPITIKPNRYYSFFIRAYTMLGPNTMKFTSTAWYEPVKTKARNKDEIDDEDGTGVLIGVLVAIFVLIAFLILVVVKKRYNGYNVRCAGHKFGLISLGIIKKDSDKDDVDDNELQYFEDDADENPIQ